MPEPSRGWCAITSEGTRITRTSCGGSWYFSYGIGHTACQRREAASRASSHRLRLRETDDADPAQPSRDGHHGQNQPIHELEERKREPGQPGETRNDCNGGAERREKAVVAPFHPAEIPAHEAEVPPAKRVLVRSAHRWCDRPIQCHQGMQRERLAHQDLAVGRQRPGPAAQGCLSIEMMQHAGASDGLHRARGVVELFRIHHPGGRVLGQSFALYGLIELLDRERSDVDALDAYPPARKRSHAALATPYDDHLLALESEAHPIVVPLRQTGNEIEAVTHLALAARCPRHPAVLECRLVREPRVAVVGARHD